MITSMIEGGRDETRISRMEQRRNRRTGDVRRAGGRRPDEQGAVAGLNHLGVARLGQGD